MSITYTWKLTSFKKVESSNMLSNIIFQTHWEKIGTDEHGNTGRFVGATPFDPNKVDPDNFISYNSLSEEIVLEWIKPVVVGEYERHVNEQISKEIEAKKTVIAEIHPTSFPWSTGTVYVPPAPAPV